MQKYFIQIPNNIKIFLNNKKKLITIIGPLAKKTLKIKLKIKIYHKKNFILITTTSNSEIPNNKKKNLKALQGTTFVLLKQTIIETSNNLLKSIRFVGLGYKGGNKNNYFNVIQLKLGFSHSVFFKIPIKLKFYCLKLTKIFIMGNYYQNITQTAFKIRALKKPEPYKGKGILYNNEKIKLKEGKKI